MNPPACNRETFPPEELLKYAGKWVAFSPDGSKIVAAAGSDVDLSWYQIGSSPPDSLGGFFLHSATDG
jgi:hypothetical protein